MRNVLQGFLVFSVGAVVMLITALVCIMALGGCGDAVVEANDMARTMDMVAGDMPHLVTGGGGFGGGQNDPCAAAECNEALDKRIQVSNPARTQER